MSEEQFGTSNESGFQCSVCGLTICKKVEVCISCGSFELEGIVYLYNELKQENEKLKLQIEKMKNCVNCKKFGTDCMYRAINYCCEGWSKR